MVEPVSSVGICLEEKISVNVVLVVEDQINSCSDSSGRIHSTSGDESSNLSRSNYPKDSILSRSCAQVSEIGLMNANACWEANQKIRYD